MSSLALAGIILVRPFASDLVVADPGDNRDQVELPGFDVKDQPMEPGGGLLAHHPLGNTTRIGQWVTLTAILDPRFGVEVWHSDDIGSVVYVGEKQTGQAPAELLDSVRDLMLHLSGAVASIHVRALRDRPSPAILPQLTSAELLWALTVGPTLPNLWRLPELLPSLTGLTYRMPDIRSVTIHAKPGTSARELECLRTVVPELITPGHRVFIRADGKEGLSHAKTDA